MNALSLQLIIAIVQLAPTILSEIEKDIEAIKKDTKASAVLADVIDGISNLGPQMVSLVEKFETK